MRGTTWAAFQSYSVLYTAHKELPNILRLVSGPTRTCESNAEVRVRHVGRPFLPSLRSSYSSVGKASNCSTTLSVQAIFQSYKWRDMLEVMICIFCQHSVIPAGHIRTSHEMTQSQTSQSWFKFKIFYNIAPYLHAKKSWSFVKPLGLFMVPPNSRQPAAIPLDHVGQTRWTQAETLKSHCKYSAASDVAAGMPKEVPF